MKKQLKTLTVLSFGAGQDSTYILYKIVLDKSFRRKYVKGDFIVVMSDTGNEHEHTYEHVVFIRKFCLEHNIPFYFLTDGAYHPATWQTLEAQMSRNSTIMSIMFPQSCTDNLKIKPIYDFLDHKIAVKYYGYNVLKRPKGKKYLSRFAIENGKIRVLIGIAADEQRRIRRISKRELKSRQLDLFAKRKPLTPIWFSQSIERVYPLVEEGISRPQIHQYINEGTDLPLPFPSNCKFCPFLSKIEMLWLYRFYPADWQKWVNYERAKIEKYRGSLKRNLGVKGERMLEQILEEAIQEFGHMTDQELTEYKMSHGHCVMSKY